MKRRNLLKAAISVFPISSTSSVLNNAWLCTHDGMYNYKYINNLLSSIFTVNESVKVIGSRYIKSHPEKNNFKALLIDSGIETAPEYSGQIDVLNKMILKHQHDFEAGNIVIVDNWVLSKTEASLCALMVCA